MFSNSSTRGLGVFVPLALLALIVVFSVHSQEQLRDGYVEIVATNGNMPVGTALFSYRNASGVLVAEAGVAAVEPMRSGRIFVDQDGANTGVALANVGDDSVEVTITLRDTQGEALDQVVLTLEPGEKVARFVNDQSLFPATPAGFTGSLTFETAQEGQAVAAVTLRQSTNAHGEPLLATLPVADLDLASTIGSAGPIIFPHLGAGGPLTTQIILINRSSKRLTGEIQLVGSNGQPMVLNLGGIEGSSFPYELEPDGTYRATLTSPKGILQGYALVTFDQGSQPPAGTAVFQIRDAGGKLVSEAGVGAIPKTTAARIYVDTIGETQTGVAIASPGNKALEVQFTLLDRNGFEIDTTQRQLPADGHFSVFVEELFPGLAPGFSGQMEIRSQKLLVPITLKLTQNDRTDLILTTLPVADLTRPLEADLMVFPQVGFGLGFSTRLIFINVDTENAVAGKTFFRQSDGSDLILPMGGETDSQFDLEIPPGGALNQRPDTDAEVSDIILDISSFADNEVVLNRGETVHLSPVAVDSEGNLRDDLSFAFSNIDSTIASVDNLGTVEGLKAGFSTLVVSSQGFVKTTTITVVGVTSGISGFGVSGLAQDLSGRIYLANSAEHTVQVTEGLQEQVDRYAGVKSSSGLKNEERLSSLFQGPASLVLNQADESLFVADSGNHVIRRVLSGNEDRVETFAGTGAPGSQNGPAGSASFNDPQGIALDSRGNLWIVDRGNHTIRRLNLSNGSVETVAGSAGRTGASDGQGSAARFNSPAGIAVEQEPLSRQLERELLGEPPPPVTVIVADTGNNLLRRVREDGLVETLTPAVPTGNSVPGIRLAVEAIPFDAPTRVAVDPFGNIFVGQSDQVLVVLPNGQRTSAAGAGTFSQPSDILVTNSGRVLFADEQSLGELQYGAPRIESLTPDTIAPFDSDDPEQRPTVTLIGGNFAPETRVLIGSVIVDPADLRIIDTTTIEFDFPLDFPSGRTTLTISNRGGIVQGSLFVEAIPLEALETDQITTVAGGSTFIGDGSPADRATLRGPSAVTLDATGNLYLSDTDHQRIRRIDAVTGIINTVAGDGSQPVLNDPIGDGDLAVAASLGFPRGLAVDEAGNIFVAEEATNRVRKIDAGTGTIVTVAGGGAPEPGPSDPLALGDNGLGTDARLNAPRGLAVAPDGTIYIADTANHRIRKLDTGIITTIAGDSVPSFSGDDGPAEQARLSSPSALVLDPSGNLYIADSFNDRIRKIDTEGIITTVVGPPQSGGAGVFAVVESPLSAPRGLALDIDGNLYIADTGNHLVRKLDIATGDIDIVAGTGYEGSSDDGIPATQAELDTPIWIAVDGSGNLLIADTGNGRLRQVDADTGIITTLSGQGRDEFLGDGGLATAAALRFPRGVAMDQNADLLVADSSNQRIRTVDSTTRGIDTVVGPPEKNQPLELFDPIDNYSLAFPGSVAADSNGILYIADTNNHRVLKVDGQTTSSFRGDKDLILHYPRGVAIDQNDNLIVADTGNHRILRISAAGLIEIVAGTGEQGDGLGVGLATEVDLNFPASVVIDTFGNLFIADTYSHRVLKVDPRTGLASVVAGTGEPGFSGDGFLASQSQLDTPKGVGLGRYGDLLIADTFNHRVRRVRAGTGIIDTIAGDGKAGFAGDGELAREARLNYPYATFVDHAGNIYVADQSNHRIRAIRGPEGSGPIGGDAVVDLTVSVVPSTDVARPGDSVTYDARVTNGGPDTATDVIVVIDLSPDVTIVSATSDSGPCSVDEEKNQIRCSVPTLDPGESVDVTVEVTVKEPTSGPVVNGSAQCSSGEFNQSTCQTGIETTVLYPILKITKTAPKDILYPDQDEILYIITVANIGNEPAEDVEVEDVLPEGVKLVSSQPADLCTLQGTKFTCSLGDLAAGQSTTIDLTVAVDDSVENTVVVNTATCRSAQNSSGLCQDTVETAIRGPESADLEVKKVGPEEVIYSAENPEDVVYTVTVTNHGPATVDNVSLQDTLPTDPISGLTAVTLRDFTPTATSCPIVDDTADITCCPGLGKLDCHLGTLKQGETKVVSVIVTPNASIVGRSISNLAGVSGRGPGDVVVDNNDSAATSVVGAVNPDGSVGFDPISDLTLTKRALPLVVQPGDEVVFELTVENHGPTTASDVVVYDVLPEGVIFVGASATQGSCGFADGVVTCSIGVLGNGEDPIPNSSVITIVVRIEETLSPTLLLNTATCESNEVDADGCSAEADVSVEEPLGLQIKKTAPSDIIYPDQDEVTYEITVTNLRNTPVNDVEVLDTLPSGVQFVSATPAGSCVPQGQTVTCSLDTVGAGQSETVTLTTAIDEALVGTTVTNTATCRSEINDTSLCTAAAQTVVKGPDTADISVIKVGPDEVLFSAENPEDIVYTISVANQGPATATNVTLKDTLPTDPITGLTAVTLRDFLPTDVACPVDPASNVITCCPGVGTVDCSLGDLPSGQTKEVTIIVTPNASIVGRNIFNLAEVGAQSPDGAVEDNASAAETEVFGAAVSPGGDALPISDLVLTKSADPTVAEPGDEVTYTLTVENFGPSTASNVIVVDTLPSGVTFVSASSTQGSCIFGAGTVSCAIGILGNGIDPAPGSSAVITIVVSIDETDEAATLTNSAICASEEFDPDEDCSAEVSINVEPSNVGPEAECKDVTVSATASCTSEAVIDNGSFDPDGASVTTSQEPAGPYSLGDTTVTLTVTDSDGATATCTGVVTVEDTTAAVPDEESLPDVNGQCSAEVVGTPTATDACSGPVAGTTSDPLTYTEAGTHVITWTFDDGAGNTSTQTQNVVVLDNTPPVPDLAELPTVTGACSAQIEAPPTATDNCSGEIPQGLALASPITGTTSDPLFYDEPGSYTVTWTFEDASGNSSTQTQTVVVEDETAPVPDLAELPTVSGECSADILGPPTATDGCAGPITGTTTDPLSYSEQGTYTVTWTFDDGNGNTSTQTQTVMVTDDTPPLPDSEGLPTINGECSADILGAPTATDSCTGPITGTTSDPLTYTEQGSHTVTWTFDDGNGNTSTQTQTVVVNDETAPLPDLAELPTVNGDCSATILGPPAATDSCAGPITGTTSDPLSYTEQGSHTVTWTFDDGNGNTSTQTQTVVVNDQTAPLPDLAELPTVSGECSASIAVPPTATDACSGPVTGTTQDPLTYTEQGSHTVTWTFDDGSGNTSTQTQTVVVDDTTPPLPDFAELPPVSGECSATISGPPTATDSCAGPITGTTNDPLTYTELGSHTVTWTFDDGNGNTSTQTQTAVVEDATPPLPDFAELPPVSGECSATISGAPTATDSCAGPITGTTTDPLTYTEQGSHTVTWTFDDGNGNTSTQTQTVTVTDSQAPVPDAEGLPLVSGECSAQILTTPTATDACTGQVIGTTSDPLSYTEQGSHTVTWTFDDGNGNTSTQTQSVVIADTTPPVPDLGTLPTVSGDCSAQIATAPTATDACAGPITGTTEDPLAYEEPGTFTVTWTFDDGNGNTSTQVQTVIVDDQTPPVPDLGSLPTVSGECSATVSVYPTATDSCYGSVTGTTNDPLTYTEVGSHTVTWTFDDGDGNTSTQTQTVIVTDTAAPLPDSEGLPTVTGTCAATVSQVPTATDSCSGPITGSTQDPLFYNTDGTFVVTWTFDDGNGHTSTQTQTVIVDDVEAPVPDAEALADVVGECSTQVTVFPTATDACVGSVSGSTSDPLLYDTLGSHLLTWTYDDTRGNTSTQTQTVRVEDNTPPVVSSVTPSQSCLWPPDHSMIPITVGATTTDNCDATQTQTVFCEIIEVTSNENPDDTGDGNTDIDWVITGPMTVELRAERFQGGYGRFYTIQVECTDESGNSTTETTIVSVPDNAGCP